MSVPDASAATEIAQSESFVDSLENLPEDVLVSEVTLLTGISDTVVNTEINVDDSLAGNTSVSVDTIDLSDETIGGFPPIVNEEVPFDDFDSSFEGKLIDFIMSPFSSEHTFLLSIFMFLRFGLHIGRLF